MKRLQVAVFGAGRLGGFHAQKLADNKRADLVAVVDPIAENRDRVAKACGTRAVENPAELLELLDAAVVAAPTLFHHALGMELLSRGIHVLMEKPLAMRRAEADALIDAANRSGAILQVGHVERFNPAFVAAATEVRRPKYIESVRSGEFTFRSIDIGVVLDLMIHDLDLVLSMVEGEVRSVEALGLSVLGGHEDVANARIEFECGCVASLSASRVSDEPARRMNVWAPRAFARLDFATRTTTLIRPSRALRERRFDIETLSPDAFEHAKGHFAEEHLPREVTQFEAVDALALETEDFLAAIREGRSPRVPGEAGRDALALAERILESMGRHAWDHSSQGPVGPMAIPHPSIIPAPHFKVASATPRRSRFVG